MGLHKVIMGNKTGISKDNKDNSKTRDSKIGISRGKVGKVDNGLNKTRDNNKTGINNKDKVDNGLSKIKDKIKDNGLNKTRVNSKIRDNKTGISKDKVGNGLSKIKDNRNLQIIKVGQAREVLYYDNIKTIFDIKNINYSILLLFAI
jgi:hypothetical protein